MRIISGKFKGRSIEFIKTIGTRPLKDSVKESIFNILSHSNEIDTKIKNSNVLDLYSGVGSFGLECLSRDAKEVTFIEKNNQISKILKNNFAEVRSYGWIGFEYIDIALGKRNFAILSKLSPWDHIPGILIVREAGGADFDFNKQSYNFTLRNKNLIVGNSCLLYTSPSPRDLP